MTSANVTEFRIIHLPSSKVVGNHHQHSYCKTHWDDLLVYQPLVDHIIIPNWLDEEEEYYEESPVNLQTFLNSLRRCMINKDWEMGEITITDYSKFDDSKPLEWDDMVEFSEEHGDTRFYIL